MSLIKELLKPIFLSLVSTERTHIRTYKLITELAYRERLKSCKNEFARKYAQHFFSQTDEDGLTIEIIGRVSTSSRPTFLELGVGDGLENNSLILLSLGWEGSWYGGEKLAFDHNQSQRLKFKMQWIDKDNIIDIYQESLSYNRTSQHEIISIDLDGNDLDITEKLLKFGAKPNLFICEYNGILPPQSNWKMEYNGEHRWEGDSYFGASLGAFVELFKSHGYFLCACNPQTGSNAFFVRSEYRNKFPDIPNSISDIYQSPFYWIDNKFEHKISPNFIKSLTL